MGTSNIGNKSICLPVLSEVAYEALLYNMQYFHGTKDSARLQPRAMALIWTFILTAAEPDSTIRVALPPLQTLMAFSTTTTGCIIS